MTANLRGVLLFLVISSYIFSQDINTELIKGFSPNIKPGSSATIVFRLSNTTENDLVLYSHINAPNNWSLFYNKTILIEPKKSIIFPVGVRIPISTLPGYHNLELTINDKNKNLVTSSKIRAQILKQIEIDIKIENIPKISVAGKDVMVDFCVYNRSNSPRRVFLESTYGTINGSNSISLDIGETKIINTYFETNPDITKTQNLMVDLIVNSGPYQNSDKSIIKIIPLKNNKSDRYHRLPSEIGLIYLYRNFGSYDHRGLQGHFFTRGSLNPENTHFLEVLARGPNQFDNTILGLYDEYYINYLSQNIEVLIGDDNFSLTPLMEYGRYGKGIRANYHDSNHNIGFFYMKPRFHPDYKEELAAYFNYSFDDDNTIKFSFLQKFMKGASKPYNLYSTRYLITPYDNFSLEAEYSFGKKYDKFSHGYSIELANQTAKTVSSIQIIDAGENFPGYYDNTRYLNSNFQYILNRKLKFSFNFHEDESNAQRDTLYGVSPYSKYLTGGTTFTYNSSNYINLFFGKRERKDRMPLNKFHYEEVFSRLSFGNKFYKFNTSINTELAHTKNLLTKSKGQSYKNSLILRYNHSQHLNLSSLFQYYNTYRYSEDRTQEFIYGADLSYSIGKHTDFSVSYQNAHNIEEYYRDRSLFDVRLSKYLFDQHQFEFLWSEAIKQKQVDDRNTYIGLKYTFHFGIPVKKIANLGQLRGRLINEGVKNIANVVINLDGRIQFTDEDGLFVFNDIEPGEHYLFVDNASLDFDDITTIKIPMVVNIEQNKLTDVQIGLTKAGSITGNIRLDFENLQNEKLVEDISTVSMKNVIVEIKLDDEIYRSIVNLNEEFNFLGLRPGDWNLKVYHNNLGNNYTIKNSEMIVNLSAGQTSLVNIDVTKKARKIRFQPTKIIIK